MPSDTTAMVKLFVAGNNLSAEVTRVDIEDVDRGADKATFVLDDPGSTRSDVLRRGAAVRIEVGWETEYALAFVGRVATTRSVAGTGARGRIEVTCTDMSVLFDVRPEPEKRQYKGPLTEVLAAMAKRAGMEVGAVKIDPMPDFKNRPVNQLDRTDWQLLQDLAEAHRARAFVEVNAAKEDSEEVKKSGGVPKLYFYSEDALLAEEPMGTLLYCRGMGRLLEFTYESVGSGASPAAAAVVADPETGAAMSRATPPAPPEPQPAPSAARTDQIRAVLGTPAADDHATAMQLAADQPVQPEDMRASKEVIGAPSDAARLEERIKQDKTRILGYSGKGVAIGTVFLRAKGSVKIEGLASWASGRWYVKRVNHIFERVTVDKKVSVTFRSRLEATR